MRLVIVHPLAGEFSALAIPNGKWERFGHSPLSGYTIWFKSLSAARCPATTEGALTVTAGMDSSAFRRRKGRRPTGGLQSIIVAIAA
jgi:hypothetical protein